MQREDRCAAVAYKRPLEEILDMSTSRHLRRQKYVEPQLLVLVEIAGELVVAGTLALQEDSGDFMAVFQYEPDYLARAQRGQAFSLDPINLPLRQAPFETHYRYSLLGALFDAAPDAWGRTVMANDEGISPTSLTESRVLLKGRGSGVGAILFATRGATLPQRPLGDGLPTLADIPGLYQTIKAIDEGSEVDEELRSMLMSSWDMGGARPKAVVQDSAGEEWIVKFPRRIDTYSRQRNEWANLEMARAIGICVPETQLFELPGGDCALLIRRFDRGAPGVFERQHYLSAVSLVSPPPDFDKRQMDTPYGASIFSYARIASIVRMISSNVSQDLQDLFARMVLNIYVANKDDHLKNTGFLMDANSPGFKYRLSPLFDVVTQESASKHMLHIGPSQTPQEAAEGRIGTIERARAGGLRWGIRAAAADAIIERVSDVVSERHHYYRNAGMGDEEIEKVERWLTEAPEAREPDHEDAIRLNRPRG